MNAAFELRVLPQLIPDTRTILAAWLTVRQQGDNAERRYWDLLVQAIECDLMAEGADLSFGSVAERLRSLIQEFRNPRYQQLVL